MRPRFVLYHCEVEFSLKKRLVSIVALGFFLINPQMIFSQSNFLPLHSESYRYLERLEIVSGKISDELHLSISPLKRKDETKAYSKDSPIVKSALRVDNLTPGRLMSKRTFQYLLTDNDEWSDYERAKSEKPI